MGYLQLDDQTGEGHSALDAFGSIVAIKDYGIMVTAVNPHTRFVGEMTPRGVWRIGTVMMGFSELDDSGAVPAYVVDYHFVHFENEQWEVGPYNLGPIYLGTLFWRLLPGVVATLYVDW